jgi:hypothetical protein
MTWVHRIAAAVVRALADAEVEDCPIVDGFERRVVDLLERELPSDPSTWDRPSEQTAVLRAVTGAEALAQRQSVRR